MCGSRRSTCHHQGSHPVYSHQCCCHVHQGHHRVNYCCCESRTTVECGCHHHGHHSTYECYCECHAESTAPPSSGPERISDIRAQISKLAKELSSLQEKLKELSAEEKCENPEKLEGEPGDCSPEQVEECHGDEQDHSCTD